MSRPSPAPVTLLTVEQFLAFPVIDGKAELVRGELRVSPPPGAPHGVAASNVMIALAVYVRRNGLGKVFGDSFGYELPRLPGTVRVPDCSFVRTDRLPERGVGPGLLKLAPDLAIEVLSPFEMASEIDAQLDDYRVSGTPLSWVIDPIRRTVMILAADAPVRWLREGDTLDADPIIPGFLCPVAEIFEGIAREPQ